MTDCTLPVEDLVAYTDGDLRGARRELVEAHLAVCLHCRERAAAFATVDHLLRDESAPIDDPDGRNALRARLAQASRRPASPLSLRSVALLLLVLALVVGPVVLHASTSIVSRTHQQVALRLSGGKGPPGTPITGVRSPQTGAPPLGFRAVPPADLPFGLLRAAQSTPQPTRVELMYRNGEQLALLLVEEPTDALGDTARNTNEALVVVRGVEVRWLLDPRPGAVAGLIWVRHGVHFEMLVTDSPQGGLQLADALRIVEALMAAQDAGTRA